MAIDRTIVGMASSRSSASSLVARTVAHQLAGDAAGQPEQRGGHPLGVVRAREAIEDQRQTGAGLDAVHRRQTGRAVPSTSPMVRRASARSVSSSSSAIDW